MPLSYSAALRLLETECRQNATALAAQAAQTLGERHAAAMRLMEVGLECLGYSADTLNCLNVLHIAGTKGKGSTATFTESIVRRVSERKCKPLRTGLYTSPHLVHVRERIKINGTAITEELFARHFDHVWHRVVPAWGVPSYFPLLTLLAYHVFISEKIDVAVIEVGLGGLCDSTNIVPRPLATAITTIGLDHESYLGTSVAEIAAQKAGIFKPGVRAITGTHAHPDGVIDVIAKEAQRRQAADLLQVPPVCADWKLGIQGESQRHNAGIAYAMAAMALEKFNIQCGDADENDVKLALLLTRWRARCERLDVCWRNKLLTMYLDGAHTEESLRNCGTWFITTTALLSVAEAKTAQRILVFGITGDRNVRRLLDALVAETHNRTPFNQILVVCNVLDPNRKATDKEVELATNAMSCLRSSNVEAKIVRCLEEALEQLPNNSHVLITGSLYLVGAALHLFDEVTL